MHRYTFPASRDARLVIDFSMGGLAIPYGSTVPLRSHLETLGPGVAQAETVVEGAPLATHVECDAGDWRQLLWYDRRLMHGGTRLDFDRIRPTTLRPFGLMWRGPTEPGQVVEVRFGFSLRGVEQARTTCRSTATTARPAARSAAGSARPGSRWSRIPPCRCRGRTRFDTRRQPPPPSGGTTWTGSGSRRRRRPGRTIFATALYHSLDQAVLRHRGEPVLAQHGPFAFDICTMWDIYRTQLPLIIALFPAAGGRGFANAMRTSARRRATCRSATGWPRARTGSPGRAAPSATPSSPTCASLGVAGVDWDWALCHMDNDLRRAYGEEYLLRGVTHPITHTLDMAFGYQCTARWPATWATTPSATSGAAQVAERAGVVVLHLRERVDPAQRRVARARRRPELGVRACPNGCRACGRSASARRPRPASPRWLTSARVTMTSSRRSRPSSRSSSAFSSTAAQSTGSAVCDTGLLRSSRATSTRGVISRSSS